MNTVSCCKFKFGVMVLVLIVALLMLACIDIGGGIIHPFFPGVPTLTPVPTAVPTLTPVPTAVP
jgi:hypothetical protein